jgi:thiamine-phosphate pyrophosphorylase
MGEALDPRALGVYVITSAEFFGRGHLDVAAAAIEGGATALQLRAPELGDDDLLLLATDLASRCRASGVLFVVNDRVDVAVAAGADGAHVGQHDDPAGARERLGAGRVLGISVRDAGEGRFAARAGADYLGVTVWPSATKPEAVAGGVAAVREVAVAVDVPVVGIGGIDPANAELVLAAGAAGVAVISAVAAAPDPAAVVRALRGVVDAHRTIAGTPGHG